MEQPGQPSPEDLEAQALEDQDQAVADMLALVVALHTAVLAQVAVRPNLSQADITQLRQEVQTLAAQFEVQAITVLNGNNGALRKAFDLADDLIDAQLRQAGIAATTASSTTRLVDIAQDLATMRIQGLSQDLVRGIQQELRLAVLTDSPYTTLVDRLGRTLDSPGRFRTLKTRAEFIARNGVQDMLNWSLIERGNSLAQAYPEQVHKRWKHIGPIPGREPRPSHVRLSGTTLPWGEKFSVEGEQAHGPHDPNLSARQTANCLCVLEIVVLSEEERAA